jgi:CDP-glycerol glycerophosphotransferase
MLKSWFEENEIDNQNFTIKQARWLSALVENKDIDELLLDAVDLEYSKRTLFYRTGLINTYNQDANIKDTKISIVMCTYNTPKNLLYRAIRSGLESTHANTELVLIDDGSSVNIECELRADFPEYAERLRYYFKSNEGIGPSRNFGVKKSTGKYILFLDSDDTIEANGLALMLTHAMRFNLELVVGKRVICNENSMILNESLRGLYGEVFSRYFSTSSTSVYSDAMPNNKLISRDAFDKYDLWFPEGYYEDALFTAKLYSQIKEYHYVNIHIHNWYKYGKDTTISSSTSLDNFQKRINAYNMSWDIVPEHAKYRKLHFHLCYDFLNYYRSYATYDYAEQREFYNELKQFILNKSEYLVHDTKFDDLTKFCLQSIKNDDFESFSNMLCDYSSLSTVNNQIQDNYICVTHYHIFVAILYALDSGKKSRLFVMSGYSNFSEVMIERLIKLKIFEEVVTIPVSLGVETTISNLWINDADAETIIPTYLNSAYQQYFQYCNPSDTFFIFHDFLPYWYYIEKNFDNIIKLEDAYDSTKREPDAIKLNGIWGDIEQYSPQYFPEMRLKSPKINKIIASKVLDNIPEELSQKVVIKDTIALKEKYKTKIHEIMSHIYWVEDFDDETAVMILTQPLALVGFCTKKEQYALYASIAQRYKNRSILIKPHPADNISYKKLNCRILKKNIPIEAYNFTNNKVDLVVSFGSSSSHTVEFANRVDILSPEYTDNQTVTNEIKKIISQGSKNRKNILSRGKSFIIRNIKRMVK